jgi:hypothetical protein
MLRVHLCYGPIGTQPSAEDTYVPLTQRDLVLLRSGLEVLDPDGSRSQDEQAYWLAELDSLIDQVEPQDCDDDYDEEGDDDNE